MTIAAPALWGGSRLGWFTMSGSNLIVSPPPYYVPENVGQRVARRADIRREDTADARLRRDIST